MVMNDLSVEKGVIMIFKQVSAVLHERTLDKLPDPGSVVLDFKVDALLGCNDPWADGFQTY